MDFGLDKEVLKLQLQKITKYIEEEDVFGILEDKPFICENQAILDYPKFLRIQIKISIHEMNLEE